MYSRNLSLQSKFVIALFLQFLVYSSFPLFFTISNALSNPSVSPLSTIRPQVLSIVSGEPPVLNIRVAIYMAMFRVSCLDLSSSILINSDFLQKKRDFLNFDSTLRQPHMFDIRYRITDNTDYCMLGTIFEHVNLSKSGSGIV
jgi:hypothetical protein